MLLIPVEGDPHGLLQEGPCRYRPPTLQEGIHPDMTLCWLPKCKHAHITYATAWPDSFKATWDSSSLRRGLVFGWEGAVFGSGLDHGGRRLSRAGRWWSDTERRVGAYLTGDYTAAHIVDPRAGETVLLDGEGSRLRRTDRGDIELCRP